MRGGGRGVIGYAAIAVGIVIILSLILPVNFWWFALAAILIALGIWYIRCG